MNCVLVIAAALQLFLLIDLAKGHGTIRGPIGRGSIWRKFPDVPEGEKNYDDMGNYCGGYQAHFVVNGGKCGICGDNYSSPPPRPHELGGQYGRGTIVATYASGSQPEFEFDIKTSHMGYVFFEICNLDQHRTESEECFQPIELATGGRNVDITRTGMYKTTVSLPSGLACEHCVVRWTYRAANAVNFCPDGTEKAGCGDQETFKNCADITITNCLGPWHDVGSPGRSSRWRTDPTAPPNYNDNELFCGGFAVQFNQNGGRCGICGDNYRDSRPRANELGGEFGGLGTIVKTYRNTNTIDIHFKLTQNHLGFVFMEMCNFDESRVESEDCFKHLKFADGNDKFYVGDVTGSFVTTVVLPKGLKCQHCIIRWTYRGGNNWGFCGNGYGGALGCGDQEHFKSCADIAIL